MSLKRWIPYGWYFLPVMVGAVLSLFAQILIPILPPILSTIDLGIAGFVIGITVRHTGTVAFLAGFLVTSLVLLLMYWDRRRISQAQSLYADYVVQAEQKRRHFLRRLDHEIEESVDRVTRGFGEPSGGSSQGRT